jgi:hypothetical protein
VVFPGNAWNGDGMPSSKPAKGFSKVKKALLALEALGIPFRGPFVTPGGQHIYVVDACLLVEAEIVDLHASGKFDDENIVKLLSDIGRSQSENKGVGL